MSGDVTAYEVRAQFENLLERDLLGPWDGPTEELPAGSSPGERYLLGRLVPRRSDVAEPVTDEGEDDDVETRPELVEESGLDLGDDAADDVAPAAAIRTRAMSASSLG